MAGVPFDFMERLGTPQSSALARQEAAATPALQTVLERELESVRHNLVQAAAVLLPRVLMFGSSNVRDLLTHLLRASNGPLARRNAKAGERERHLALYLQRVATKNDTFSEFGPSGWGKSDRHSTGLALRPEPGIARRDIFLERWVAHALAAAINEDVPGSNLQVPAMEPHAFEVLIRDMEEWPATAARDKWLALLRELDRLRNEFGLQTETNARQLLIDEARSRLQSIGAERQAGDRFLYAATNPIGEECFRECRFELSEPVLNEIAVEAEPWIDLWRDTYAFVASRVAATLRQVMEQAGAKSGTMSLPDFLRACETARLPLTGLGLVAPAVIAFQEVKAAFRQRLEPHAGLTEYQLTVDDCHVVRDRFNYAKFDEYTYPSADLQLAAANVEAVGRGSYRWVLAELHPPPALLHHCMYWACPDQPELHRALQSNTFGKPNFHFGFSAADFTAHTTVRAFDALPDLTNFVAPQRSLPAWRRVSPDQAQVYVDEQTGDVALRTVDGHEHLGSFARAWVIPLGFHPFQFGLAPHTPRLRCGNVVVQRRTWTVTLEEFPTGRFNGTSSNLLVAVEQLRAKRDLPRHVYIRPTEKALRRSGAEGRDKDTKPIYIDFESYLFLELFYRWLGKAGELEVTEMLPAPNELLWQEPDGRRTFELRTLILPKKT
jgi:hypothetical protein